MEYKRSAEATLRSFHLNGQDWSSFNYRVVDPCTQELSSFPSTTKLKPRISYGEVHSKAKKAQREKVTVYTVHTDRIGLAAGEDDRVRRRRRSSGELKLPHRSSFLSFAECYARRWWSKPRNDNSFFLSAMIRTILCLYRVSLRPMMLSSFTTSFTAPSTSSTSEVHFYASTSQQARDFFSSFGLLPFKVASLFFFYFYF